MAHSPVRPFERDSPHQNLKLRLSYRGWPNCRFLGELSRFWSSRAYSIEWNQKIVKFWFRWVGICWLNTNVLRFHMSHSPARPFEKESLYQNFKYRLSHRGCSKRRFLGELSRFWTARPSPVQSSPVQSSPVQSSPVQSSPVQSSPGLTPGRLKGIPLSKLQTHAIK